MEKSHKGDTDPMKPSACKKSSARKIWLPALPGFVVGVLGGASYLLLGGEYLFNIPLWASIAFYPGFVVGNRAYAFLHLGVAACKVIGVLAVGLAYALTSMLAHCVWISVARRQNKPAATRHRVMKWRKPFLGVALTALTAFAMAGCVTATVNPHLIAHPEGFRRVAILPICSADISETDYMISFKDLETFRQRTRQQLLSSLTNCLTQKGYQVVGPVRVLCQEEDWAALDLDASQILRRQFELEMIATPHGETNLLYDCQFVQRLEVLRRKLRLPEADALVLLERSSEYVPQFQPPPPSAAGDAALALFAIGGVLTGHFEAGKMLDDHRGGTAGLSGKPPAVTHFTVYIFDLHSREILFRACHTYGHHKNSGNAVRALLKSLPKAGK